MFWLGVDKLQGVKALGEPFPSYHFYYKYTSPKQKQENKIRKVLK